MRRILFLLLFFTLQLSLFNSEASAQQRRPVDSQHPLWLVHVDVWNQADPQKIIDLIPDEIKPYVCMNLSLSCAYDTELNIHQRPQNAIRTYKSWASVCQMNNMWFTLQPASGGHTHIHENDLETFEYFFKRYPNFLGWNYAEQFWGFDEAGDLFSSTQTDRIELFSKLIPMHHKYGGFLTISFCGNIWSHALNPVGMLKRNPKLLQASRDYPEAILWLYKYTTSSCFYNNESVSFGPFVSGLAKNYGVRYDNCGWNGAMDALFGENHGKKYPTAAGIGTVMEQTCQNGGAVWDGPELIWTEDFQNLSTSTYTDAVGSTGNYTQRNWGTFPGFRNIWLDMFRKIIDGTMYIPTQQEVIDKTKIIIVNDVTSGSDEDKYATWGNLYDGLYKQNDPFNRGNGQWMDNFLYLKSTGRYGTIPMTPQMTTMATGIPTKIKKSMRNSVWPTIAKKQEAFNAAYPEVSTGDLFVSRYRNQLVTYTPYSYLNVKTTASANIPLQYNTCQSLDLKWGKLSSALVKEYADSITFYLNNYRTDTTKAVVDEIVVNGVTSEPSIKWNKRVEATASVTPKYDPLLGTYTITVSHNGPVDLKVMCQGEATGRKSDYVGNTRLEIPKQPEQFNGTLIIEAEDMNYRSVSQVVDNYYFTQYKSVRGHSSGGFVVMGTSTSGVLMKPFKVHKAGEYKVAVRYMNNTTREGDLYVRANNVTAKKMAIKKTGNNVWRKDTVTVTLNEGNNNIYLMNMRGIGMYIDQVIMTPADEPVEKFAVTLRDSEVGKIVASASEAAEGETVTLTAKPSRGYSFEGWNIIHGNVTFTIDGNVTTFVMPDDNVTLEPVFKNKVTEYVMDMTDVLAGTFPKGWRAVDGTTIQQYPNSYSSGPRTMTGFPGTFSKGIYWRSGSCDYGRQSGFPLTLEPGNYKLVWSMAAWKGSPQYKAVIQNTSGTAIKSSSYFTAAPDAVGSTSTDLSSCVERTLEFTITRAGNYIINFQNNGTGFSEFLLCACKIEGELPPVLLGDANGDGVISVADLSMIASYILGETASSIDLDAADVNEDGDITVADLSMLATMILGQN